MLLCRCQLTVIVKMSMTSPIDINVPTRALLDAETKGSFVRWFANLNIKRNLTSMFVNRYLPYTKSLCLKANVRDFQIFNKS